MNQVATQERTGRQLSPVETYTLQVIGDDEREADLWSALPDHVKPDRFKRNLVNLLMQKPEMMRYDPRYTFREVSKAAALGLLLDPQLGEGYIVPVWNGQAKRTEPQLRVGYRGLLKLARQSGDIANIYPGEVREADHFIADEGTDKRLEHQPDYTRPRGPAVCYYAVVIYKDGTKDFEVMDIESIHQIRDKSDAWRAYKAKKISSTPWATDEGEMCKKTVLRRLIKRVPQSPELSDAITMENTADFDGEVVAVPSRRVQPVRPAGSIENRLDAFASGEEAAPESEAETNETSATTVAAQVADQPEESPAKAPPSSGETASSEAEEGTSPDDADLAKMPAKLKAARDKGAAARRSNYAREVPKALKGAAHTDEAEAFLRGWNDEDNEIRAAEQFGE